MKQHSSEFATLLAESTDIKSTYRAIAEFNHNRYTGTTVTGNDWYPEIVPLSSVTEPIRPDKGVLFTRATNSAAAIKLVPEFTDSQDTLRYYFPSEDYPYRYWSSESVSLSNGSFSSPQVITVMYDEPVWCNKIVVGFEDSVARPEFYTVEIREAGNWSIVTSDYTTDSKGRIIFWLGGSGWQPTPNREYAAFADGIRLTVNKMESQSYLNVIEISARLETDISDYVERGARQSLEISDDSFVSPLGEVSSNAGSITLSNFDGTFNNDNSSSLYYGLIQKNVKITQSVGFDVNGFIQYVDLSTFYVEDWERGEHSITASLKDGSLYLQGIDCPRILLKNTTPGAAMWRILDVIGFGDYVYETDENDSSNLISYFWTDPEESVWENFKRICIGTQTSAYFDEYGTLRIVDGKRALRGGSPVWDFTAVDVGAKLADIERMDFEKGFDANSVKVNYYQTKLPPINQGVAEQRVLWEAESPTVLRASTLIATLPASGITYFRIDPNDAKAWPFSGMVNIEGEIISWKAKRYVSYGSGGSVTYHNVSSLEQQEQIDKQSNSFHRYKNHYNGTMIIDQRGLWGSTPAAHYVSNKSAFNLYRSTLNASTSSLVNSRFTINRNDGYLTMNTTGTKTYAEITYLRQSDYRPVSATSFRIGTRLRFRSQAAKSYQFAGIGLQGTGATGFYVGITTSETAEELNTATVTIWEKDGSSYRGIRKVSSLVITKNQWYDIDVYRIPGSSDRLNVMVNGTPVGSPTFTWYGGTLGNLNVWVRGRAVVDFEYMYAVPYNREPVNGVTRDVISGSYYSDAYKLYINPIRSNKRGKVYYRAYSVFCEFSPVVHEIREFDVQFEEQPVVASSIYSSNESKVGVAYYMGDSYGAKFALYNAARENAIVAGEDTLTIGEENTIDQKFFIYGRPVEVEEADQVEASDPAAIRAEGLSETTFDTTFIQDKSGANKIANWISTLFSSDNRTLSLEVFGNPLVQIGDRVRVHYPLRGLNYVEYVIISCEHTWDTGLTTTLRLRRATA